MSKRKNILINQLDQRVAPFENTLHVFRPEKGWINNIRISLNMTLAQLAKKLNMTAQGVNKMEEREANNSITLSSLMEVADALDLKLVYALVPKNGSFEELIEKRAKELAESIISRTHHNMSLENQAVNEKFLHNLVEETAAEYKRTVPKKLWD